MPLVPLAPAIVLVVGITTAVAVGLLGLANLRAVSDQTAAARASVLSATLAARLRASASADHGELIRRAASHSGAEVALVDADGALVADATLGPPAADALVRLQVAESGMTITQIGRTAFSVRALGPPFRRLSVITFVPAPDPPEGARALVRTVLLLTALLLGVAVAVASVFGRDLHAELDFVRSQISAMAEPHASPTGTPVAIRTADAVGVLAGSFNVLVDRFTASLQTYELDLERVATLDRDRAAFLATLSHELRTPLNAILGFADLLLSEIDGPLSDDARENLEMVRASGSHLRGLIDDILELSALESGQLRLSRALVDAHEVAEDVMREASVRLAGKPIVLQVLGDKPAPVWADERRLWQILSNVVGNAIKFTEHGSVVVELRSGNQEALLTVRDTGPGIADSDVDAIFHEYRQLGPAHVREKGTGLGLFIARRLVAMHGGTIAVSSRLGEGSQFTIRLPRAPAPEEVAAEAERVPSEAPPPGAEA